MRIYSLSKVLAFPLIIICGFFLAYLFTGYRSEYGVYIFIPVVLLVAIYIFHGVIDFWWLERHPIPLEGKMREWFSQYMPFYNKISDEERVQFENRLSLYVEGREFKSVGTNELKEVPFDICAIIASQCILMTAGVSDYLLGDMDRIYLYKHPFPSPQHQFLHTAETHIEDGMILLSLEHALPGIINPSVHYNITMHAYAEAFVTINPHYDYPLVHPRGWDEITKVIGIDRDSILKTLGFEEVNLLPVHIVAFFCFNEGYNHAFPQENRALNAIFNYV